METNNTLSSALATAPLALRVKVAALAYSGVSPCGERCYDAHASCPHAVCGECRHQAALYRSGVGYMCLSCASEAVVEAACDGEDDAEVAAAIVLADAALAGCVS